MRLTELRPRFLVYEMIDGRQYHRDVDAVAEANGVLFLCPKCFQANGGSVGTHSIICWAPGVPPEVVPGPGRWNLVGTGFHDLSLVAGSSSVKLTEGCQWHGFVQNGEVT